MFKNLNQVKYVLPEYNLSFGEINNFVNGALILDNNITKPISLNDLGIRGWINKGDRDTISISDFRGIVSAQMDNQGNNDNETVIESSLESNNSFVEEISTKVEFFANDNINDAGKIVFSYFRKNKLDLDNFSSYKILGEGTWHNVGKPTKSLILPFQIYTEMINGDLSEISGSPINQWLDLESNNQYWELKRLKPGISEILLRIFIGRNKKWSTWRDFKLITKL